MPRASYVYQVIDVTEGVPVAGFTVKGELLGWLDQVADNLTTLSPDAMTIWEVWRTVDGHPLRGMKPPARMGTAEQVWTAERQPSTLHGPVRVPPTPDQVDERAGTFAEQHTTTRSEPGPCRGGCGTILTLAAYCCGPCRGAHTMPDVQRGPTWTPHTDTCPSGLGGGA